MCRKCCEQMEQKGQSCPSCRRPSLNNVNTNRSLARIVDRLKVACHDCKQKMKRERFERHFNRECVIPCPQQCDIKELTRFAKDPHIRDECPETVLSCPSGCEEKMARKLLSSHDSKCPNRIISCYRCDAKFARQETTNHDQVCPNKMVSCPYCGVQQKQGELQRHKARCDSAPARFCSPTLRLEWHKSNHGNPYSKLCFCENKAVA